jgi:hypothetical protein
MTTFPKELVYLEHEVQMQLDNALAHGDHEKVRNLMDAIIEIHAQRKQPKRGRPRVGKTR